MWTFAAFDCYAIWSGLHPRVIGEAIDRGEWTAARPLLTIFKHFFLTFIATIVFSAVARSERGN